MARVTKASLAIVIVTIALVTFLRVTLGGQTSELRDRLVALEQQVQQLSQALATAPRESPPQQIAFASTEVLEEAPATLKKSSIHDDQTAFDEILARTGIAPSSVQPHQLRRVPASVSDVSRRLLASFNTSALAEHAFVTHAGCEGAVCAVDVTFNDARSAVEHEMELGQWLSEADGSCSFTLEPLALDSTLSNDARRRLSLDCG